MSERSSLPELIISLSRDKVRIDFAGQSDPGILSKSSEYKVDGLFLEDQLSSAMDAALTENPSLVENFKEVAIVLVDRPNICLPKSYSGDDTLYELASRYLRVGPGDMLKTDIVSGNISIAYSIPACTLNVFREYYANAGPLHLTSIVWNAINHLIQPSDNNRSRIFFLPTNNTLMVIGQTSDKMTFSKSFFVRDKSDIAYYAIACSKMLHPVEKWWLTIKDDSVYFDVHSIPQFTIHHQLELPALHHLIARHGSCAS